MDYLDFCDIQEAKEARYERWLEEQPICDECGDHIQTEFRYLLGGRYYCEDCVNRAAELVEGEEV